MVPAFQRAVNIRAWTLAATISLASAFGSSEPAQASDVVPNSLEDYILFDMKQDNPNLTQLERLRTLNYLGTGRASYIRSVHEMNRFHAAPDEARFETIEFYSARQLFEMMVHGGEEFYTSSYDAVLDRFESAMQRRNRNSLFQVAPDNLRASILPFLHQAVTYNAQDRVTAFIQTADWPEVLDMFDGRIRRGDQNAILTLAEIMHAVDNPQTKTMLEQRLQNNYGNARNNAARDHYGLAAAHYNALSGRAVIALQNASFYAPKPVESLARRALFGRDGVHRQLVVFPTHGREAQSGFDALVSTYAASSHFRVENRDGFVKISSRSGHPVEIYANLPTRHPNDIFESLGGRSFGNYADVEFDAVIDRSANDYRDNIDAFLSRANSIVFAAKNGDSQNTRTILSIAPQAHIIATPRVGKPADPTALLFNITESIRQHGTVDWAQQAQFLSANGLSDDFILPPDNQTQTMARTAQELVRIKEMARTRPLPNPARDPGEM